MAQPIELRLVLFIHALGQLCVHYSTVEPVLSHTAKEKELRAKSKCARGLHDPIYNIGMLELYKMKFSASGTIHFYRPQFILLYTILYPLRARARAL